MKSTCLPNEDTGQGPGPGALILLVLNLPMLHHQRIMVKYLLHLRLDPDQAHRLRKGVWFPIEISSELEPGWLVGHGIGKPGLGSDKNLYEKSICLGTLFGIEFEFFRLNEKSLWMWH